jgi:hypothetical protein
VRPRTERTPEITRAISISCPSAPLRAMLRWTRRASSRSGIRAVIMTSTESPARSRVIRRGTVSNGYLATGTFDHPTGAAARASLAT